MGLDDLVPDRVPDWLVNQVRKSKGTNMGDFTLLDEFYKETDVIKSDRFDRSHFASMRKKADELDDLALNRWTDKPSWFDLIQDEFLGLYKGSPQTRKENEMNPTHRINHATMSRAYSTREWAELRTYTSLDEWTSAMAAVDFGLKLAELFDEQEELMDAQKKIDEKNKQVQELLEKLKSADEKQQDAEDLLQELKEALNGEGGYGEAVGDVKDTIKGSGNQIRQAARQAAREAKEESEGSEAMIAFFGTEPGALTRMDAAARMELAKRIRRNSALKELADKVGRFVRLALAEQAQKIVHGVDEVHNVETGDDIHRVLPSELMYLADDDLDILFFMKFAEKKLLQYQLRGTEKVARGAIICMIDSSGSMYGSRETWAKAVGIALLHIAAKQGRDFYGIIFSSQHDPLIEFYFPKGIAKPHEVLDFAEAAYHGGTDFMVPINRSVEVLKEQFNSDNAQKGDLVMVTDGEAPVNEEWLDRYQNAKKELNFRMYSCLIGVHSDTLNAISDQIYNITEFATGGDVQDIFGYI